MMRLIPVLLVSSLLNCISAGPAVVQPRNAGGISNCKLPGVKCEIEKFERIGASAASKICSIVLHRTNPAPVTKTATKTVTKVTTLDGTTTETVSFGAETVFTTTSVTDTVLTTLVSTETDTVVSEVTSYSTTDVTTTVTNSLPTTTVTTTTYVDIDQNPPDKRTVRAVANVVGQVYPGCPKALRNIPIGVASEACSCILGPVKTTTKTATVTATAHNTVNDVSTDIVTVPTDTIVDISTVTATVTSSYTYITTVTDYETDTTGLGVTVTDTATQTLAQSTVVDVVPITHTYQTEAAVPTGSHCVYNEYTRYEGPYSDPTHNYAAGVERCKQLCDPDPQCKFFLFYTDDQNYDWCIIDNTPYQPAYLQCNLPFAVYDSAWSKVG